MDDPVRLTRPPITKITQNASESEKPAAPAQDTKQVQEGIASAKDSFQTKGEQAFTVDTASGQLKFGDGVHGKTPPTDNSQIHSSYRNGSGQAGNTAGSMDPNEMVQYVLRESYVQTSEDLKSYAEKVKQFNSMRKELRDGAIKLNQPEAASTLEKLAPGKSSNIMETLYEVFRNSVQSSNEDKQYYLSLLDKMHRVSTDISGHFPPPSSASRVRRKPDDD